MKKTANYLIIFLTLMLLQACSSIAESQPRTNAEEQTLIGRYIYGHEVNTFQPCGKKEIFWVKGSNEILELMARKYSNHTAKPYDEVFVEIIGDYTSKAIDGFAMNYDGQIYVTKMVLMKKKTGTDCK
ncbi:MAG: hypothetical protein JKY01_02445 [Pseudomonadales bacterium]|nr:hypothetical protein [Pseudomonadales bacterium]